jgi:hypothetical protein
LHPGTAKTDANCAIAYPDRRNHCNRGAAPYLKVEASEVVMLAGQFALTIAAFFSGAAVYVLASEQPARLMLDDKALLTQWKPAYKRGAAMQASLALIGGVLGIAAWWLSGDWRWLAGAVALLLPWPYTLLVIKPTNDALLATDIANAGPESRRLVEKWGQLHVARAGLGVVATLFFLWAAAAI